MSFISKYFTKIGLIYKIYMCSVCSARRQQLVESMVY